MNQTVRRVLLIKILFFSCLLFNSVLSQSIYFDESTETLKLGNANFYEIGINKFNGSIIYINDKTAGETVSSADPLHPIWKVIISGYEVRSSDYSTGTSMDFLYNWNPATNILSLIYIPDPASNQQIGATVYISLSEDSFFDILISLDNNFGAIIDKLCFPNRLQFNVSEIETVLIPHFFPGVALNNNFFTELRELPLTYPGSTLHAAYAALNTTKGDLSIYSLHDPDSVRAVQLGFEYLGEWEPGQDNPDAQLFPGTKMKLVHDFPVWIYDGGNFESQTVRIQISKNFTETIFAYKNDNNIVNFRSLQDKLGNSFDEISKSVVHNLPARENINKPFSDWPGIIEKMKLPKPAIIMPSIFWDGSFHQHHPDYIPPDPQWGTTSDFAAMFDGIHALGYRVMPFTQPVWWDENSPTMLNLPGLTANEISVLDKYGNPTYTHWDNTANGYFVSPNHPFVKQRLDQNVFDMTQTVPSDILYEDVLGAWDWRYDFNPSSPNPLALVDGYVEHLSKHQDKLILTEAGHDRVADLVIGFMGPLRGESLTLDRFNDEYGAGNWDPYPSATFLFHDKNLIYRYWLNAENTHDFGLQLAFGYMNCVVIRDDPIPARIYNDEWLIAAHDFQSIVSSRFVGEQLLDYVKPTPGISVFDYESVSVLKNWNPGQSYPAGNHQISPDGVIATSNSGDLTAGMFTHYNNQALSTGEHYIIEQRLQDEIIIHHSRGEDTELSIQPIAGWNQPELIAVLAFDREDKLIHASRPDVNNPLIVFNCNQNVYGQFIAYYKIIESENLPDPEWEVYFDNSTGDLVFGNRDFYELSIDRYGHGLLYIHDKATDTRLSIESYSLWRAHGDSENGHVEFFSGLYDPLDYEWSEINKTLTLYYIPDQKWEHKVTATVVFTLSNGPYLDMDITIDNDADLFLDVVSFPNNLYFSEPDINNVYLPYGNPGIVIDKQFFSPERPPGEKCFGMSYPEELHADLMGIDILDSHLAIYSIRNSKPINTICLNWDHSDAPAMIFHHEFMTWIDVDNNWTSPVVRIQTGKPFDQVLEDYRIDNNIIAYPSIEQKLANKTNNILSSPLYYLSFADNWEWDFQDVPDKLGDFPSPSIFLLSDYYPDGYYGSHPDYLPPDTELGTTADFAQIFDAAHDLGQFVMPVTIPAWWNMNSPSVQNFNGTMEDIAQLTIDMQPITENIDGQEGFFVTPTHPYVVQKVSDIIRDLTQTVPGDLIFADNNMHMDPRNAGYDFNMVTFPDPLYYYNGWFEHTLTHQNSNLVVSSGYDRLAETVTGFCGTSFFDNNDPLYHLLNFFGDENWDYYPISPVLYGDKVLFYQSSWQETLSKNILCWNLSFGVMLNMAILTDDSDNYQNSNWFPVVNDFQKHVLSNYAGDRMSAYNSINPDVKSYEYGNTTVTTNWSGVGSYNHGPHTIPPSGVIVENITEELTAGVFSSFNGEVLAPVTII